MEKRKKHCINKKLLVFSIPALILSIVAVCSLIEQNEKISTGRAQIKELEEKIEYEQAQNILLNNELAQIETDAYIERIAREKLRLARPGDKVFIDRGKIR